MKPSKDSEVLDLIAKLQEQMNNLDKKIDLIIGRVMSTPSLMAQQAPKPNYNSPPAQKEKVTFNIICSDCGKESSLPFKPTQDRPVYCKECFTLRKKGGVPVKIVENKPNLAPSLATSAPKPELKPKKKAAPAKKVVAKKKPLTKKKK